MMTITGSVTCTRATITPSSVNMSWIGRSIRPSWRKVAFTKPELPSTTVQA